MKSSPLLSVVIPTFNRPQLLQRAILSALQSGPAGYVEIIVVPNGPSKTWKSIAVSLASNPNILWHPISESNANAARNHGMAIAKGKFLRFLDDDDYFYTASIDQLLLLEASNYQASQGAVDVVKGANELVRRIHINSNVDFVLSMLQINRVTLSCSLIFLRESVKDVLWDPSRRISQDVAWALAIAGDREMSLLGFSEPVAAWVQHDGPRTSTGENMLKHHIEWANILLHLIYALENTGRLSDKRKYVAINSIWQYAHNAFPLAPVYWSKFVANILKIDPDSRPDAFHSLPKPFSTMNPIALEWIMTPHRFLRTLTRIN